MTKQPPWDPKKAASNLRDHGVSFEEGLTVFEDPRHIIWFDDDNADGKARINVIGFSERARMLFVVALEIDDDYYNARIISVRKAERFEEIAYAKENQK